MTLFHMIPMSLMHRMNSAPGMYHSCILSYSLFCNMSVSFLTDFCGENEAKNSRKKKNILFKTTELDSEEINIITFR